MVAARKSSKNVWGSLRERVIDEHVEKMDNRRTRMTLKVEIKDNKLFIEIDLEKPTPSSSGKTLVVASTHGNIVTTAKVDDKPITIGLNAYIKPWATAELLYTMWLAQVEMKVGVGYVSRPSALVCEL
jgi:hypothetical protein